MAEPQTPLIVRDGIYSRPQLIAAFGIALSTLHRWESAGLQRCTPGTKSIFYHGGDVIDFLKKFNRGAKAKPRGAAK